MKSLRGTSGRGGPRAFLALAAAAVVALAGGTAASQTLAAVKARGALLCGVNQGLPGFSYADDRGPVSRKEGGATDERPLHTKAASSLRDSWNRPAATDVRRDLRGLV